jgi:hypothetical protein
MEFGAAEELIGGAQVAKNNGVVQRIKGRALALSRCFSYSRLA